MEPPKRTLSLKGVLKNPELRDSKESQRMSKDTQYQRVSQKKVYKLKYWLLIKNPQFLHDHHQTWAILRTHEVVILTKFHEDRAKIVDFLLIANFWASTIFYCSHFSFIFKDLNGEALLNVLFKNIDRFQKYKALKWKIIFKCHFPYEIVLF